jgi:L-gulonolactone oxidase
MLTGLRIVTASGEVLDLREGMAEPFDFDAARVHLGALGVITRATLRVVPAFRLHATETTRPLDEVFARLDEYMAEPYFRFWWFPWTDLARVWIARPTEREADPPRPAFTAYLQDSLIGNRLSETLYACARSHPPSVRLVNRLIRRLLFAKPSERVDQSDRIFNFLIQVRQYVMEYAIPIEHTASALRELKTLIERENFGAHLPVEVRFTPPARGWLDMAHGRATCYIGVIMYKPFGTDMPYDAYFRAVDEMMRTYGGRPHWAKVHHRDGQDMRALYPRFEDFARLRAELDPAGMFLNDYLRRFF